MATFHCPVCVEWEFVEKGLAFPCGHLVCLQGCALFLAVTGCHTKCPECTAPLAPGSAAALLFEDIKKSAERRQKSEEAKARPRTIGHLSDLLYRTSLSRLK